MASATVAEPPLRLERRARVRGLYVIVEPDFDHQSGSIGSTARGAADVARWSLEGGARLIQLRDKRDKGLILPLARQLAALCQEYSALLIVNDHVDIAMLVEADGVHLGQRDLPVAEARRLLPAEMLIGVSTALLEEALAAREAGADYIAVGAMYPTISKENTRPAGLATLRKVREHVGDRPLVAIGGIDETNVTDVCDAGADAVAVISAVARAADVKAAAQRLVALMESRGRGGPIGDRGIKPLAKQA